jgi:hypothetical protein
MLARHVSLLQQERGYGYFVCYTSPSSNLCMNLWGSSLEGVVECVRGGQPGVIELLLQGYRGVGVIL